VKKPANLYDPPTFNNNSFCSLEKGKGQASP